MTNANSVVYETMTVGSVVKIPTAVAYEEWSEILATLQYNPRSHIYGVIHEHTTRGGIKFTMRLGVCLIWVLTVSRRLTKESTKS